MALFGSDGGADVGDLIAQRRYPEAITLLRARLSKERYNAPLRMQLADLLVTAGRGREAVPVYLGLADEFAADGFAARAIALLKKVQKIDPGRSDVEAKLAAFVKGGSAPAPAPVALAPEPPRPGAPSAGAYDPSAVDFEMERPVPDAPASHQRSRGPEFGLPMVFDPGTPDEPPPARVPAPEPAAVAAPAPVTAPEPVPSPAPPPALEPEPELIPLTPEELPGELLDGIQDALSEPRPPAPPGPVVESPLFSDFSEQELAAVIRELQLLTFEAGDMILHQGDEGGSLFVITSGKVKAWLREPGGRRHVLVRVMDEGDFFGEISLLTGEPRSATVIAASDCELLELRRDALDKLCQLHPRARQVLEDFAQERLATQAASIARNRRR